MNIIFILSDDQGHWALGSAGNDEIITPNLDKLAQNGVRYDNFFCASPVCSPARASIVTGEIPSCHGVIDWLSRGNADTEKHPYMKHPHFQNVDKPIEYLDGRPSYIAELAKNGYNCGHSGKWHLGNIEQAKEGFKNWFTLLGGGCAYFNPDTFENGHFNDDNRYVTDVITEKALEYLKDLAKDDKPFYLSVHYTAPHSPWDKDNHKKEDLDLYKDCEFNSAPRVDVHKDQVNTCPVGYNEQTRRDNLRGYYASITAMDRCIGEILDELEKTGKADDTLIIFSGDNGMNMGHHGIWGKGNGTYPQNMYDTSVKVPFIISSPKIFNKNTVNTNLRSHLDLFETILDLAEVDYKKGEKQCGNSFAKELLGEKMDSSKVVISSEYGKVRMLRDQKRKLVCNYINGNDMYFNLEKDSGEQVNLINNPVYSDEISKKRAELDDFFEKYSRKECDAKNFDVKGKGQNNLCYKEKSFDKDLKFFHTT